MPLGTTTSVAGQEGGRAPVVGTHVYIAGTGQWYQGEHFGAVVVDVRDSDQTVKVRFTDGGYKRYQISQYNTLVQDVKYAVQMPEEWYHDDKPVRRASVYIQSDMKKMHDEIHDLEIKLQDTVNRGDFLKAHELQESLKKLKGAHTTPKGSGVEQTPAHEKEAPSVGDIIRQAAGSAARGGLAGAAAMTLQVTTLMWMRTIMNYQYRYGTGTVEAAKTLWKEGGIRRFYRGIGPALIQGPVSRFGDTAANAGVLALFEHNETARTLPTPVKTVFSSAAAASMRILLVPVDTVKTIMQVEGKEGLNKLAVKYKAHGAPVMFHGALATSTATFVGHYPWFTVFNTLQASIPQQDTLHMKLLRNAAIGFCASATSDTISNSLRVVKTIRQTNDTMPYAQIVKDVIEKDGVMGLMGRGLKTRLIANGTQGIMFSVLFKLFEDGMKKRSESN